MALCCAILLLTASSGKAGAVSWSALTGVPSPPERSGAMMAYDAGTSQVILFGGQASTGSVLGDMWAWNGYSWSQLAPPTLPYARVEGAMAYDPASGQLILFGGSGYSDPQEPVGSSAGDTWSWNGATWTRLSPANSPAYTSGASLAYDPAAQELILFGGESLASPAQPTAGADISSQMWAWNGSDWTQLSPAQSPSARAEAAMAYDSADSSLVLFGGGLQQNISGWFVENFPETWTWNGSTWSRSSPVSSPPGRTGAGIAFDGATGHIVLSGGGTTLPSGDLLTLGDSWAWNGSTWSSLGRGPGGYEGAMAYDAATRQIVDLPASQPVTYVYGPLTVETTSLAAAVVGGNYSQTLQWAGGAPYNGFAPDTWSVVGGSLPAGLSLSASGVISGVPTASSSSSFTAEVVDRDGDIAREAYQLVVDPSPAAGVWVANGGYSGLEEMPLGIGGNLAPLATIEGSQTQLDGTSALGFDSSGDLYVANVGDSTITEYAPGMTGNVSPVRTISGPDTGLSTPEGVTVDSTGRIYVANESAQTITVYAADASGDDTPVQTIGGSDTGLSAPWGIQVTAQGDIWVANYGNSTLTEYPDTANGNVPPTETLTGASSGLSNPEGMGQDGSGNLWVANPYLGTVNEYPSDSSATYYANAQPIARFSLGTRPDGVDFDASGDPYFSDAVGAVESEQAGPHGVFYQTSIAGPSTGFSAPQAVAVEPPLAVASTVLDTFALGRHGIRRLAAYRATGPLHWRLVRGRLPHGLHLSRSGVISGTCRRAGRFRLTVSVRDSSRPAMTAVSPITITVAQRAAVTAVQPDRALPGRRVTILGAGFSTSRRATAISFGRVRAVGVRCRTSTRCTAIVPPALPGRRRVAVTATVEGLTSSRSARFSYRR